MGVWVAFGIFDSAKNDAQGREREKNKIKNGPDDDALVNVRM